MDVVRTTPAINNSYEIRILKIHKISSNVAKKFERNVIISELQC